MAVAGAAGGSGGGGYISDEEISKMAEDITLEGAATTYAAAAKKQLVDPNLVVYFHRTHERREPCHKGSFDKFMEFVLNEVGYDKKLTETVNLNWSGYGYGRGVIAAFDEPTIAILKEMAKKYTEKTEKGVEIVFKIWTRSEFGHRHLMSGFLHGRAYCSKKGNDILKWIFQINGLHEFKPMLIMYEKHPQQKGVFIKIEVCDQTKDAILKKNLVLRAGICVLRLNYKFIQGEAESAEKLDNEMEQDTEKVNADKAAATASSVEAEK